MNKTGMLIVLSGPSGSGKGTILGRLLQRRTDTVVSVSATTRAPRPGEQDGVSYFFRSRAEFEEMICLLSGADADYSGMARAYRRRLTENGTLTPLAQTEAPLYVELLGATEVDDRFLCFPVKRSAVLTSYADAAAIAGELREAGVGALNLRYTGWANGGLSYTVFNRAKLLSALGGKRGYE